eukprot:TRINITY_DN1396_c0_g1_i2.p1 TRINITY_DN1396_c0_g1~~TRINITY_DN1396_c0_g1_i2.p1  ORF type:complete len:519 (+),score=66.19 TRINITY_DN1396_c0_g1_i2:158-1714(+)
MNLEEPMKVAIIGTGAYAQALANRLSRVGMKVVFGSRSASTDSERTPMMVCGVEVKGPCEAASDADIVVLAIPMEAHSEMANCIRGVIAGRGVVIIDVSNASLSSSSSPSTWPCARRKKPQQNPNTIPAPLDTKPHLDDKCKGCKVNCSEKDVVDIENLFLPPKQQERQPLREEEGGNDIPQGTEKVDEEDQEEYSHAERLQKMMPEDVHVVKAFNTVSAYALKSSTGLHFDDRVLVCGDNVDAKFLVFRLIHAIGMRPVDAGFLSASREIEKRPLSFFQEWHTAVVLSCILFFLISVYIVVRELVLVPAEHWGDVFLLKFNVIVAWHAIALMTLTFGGGVAAVLRQLTTGTMRRPFPSWLDGWLRARKALGLLGLLSIGMHMIAALLTSSLFTSFPYMQSREGAFYQASLMLGILSTATYACLGVTSLPSVASTMSWREWNFMQSKMGHVGLGLGTLHVIFVALALERFDVTQWPSYLPPASILAAAPAALVIILRMLVGLPCISESLNRIRARPQK